MSLGIRYNVLAMHWLCASRRERGEMSRIRAVKRSGRQCRLCRRKGRFRAVYCVHGTGSAFMDGMGRLFDSFDLFTKSDDAISDLESPVSVTPGKVVRQSQVERVLGNFLATRAGQNGRGIEGG